MTSNLPCPAKPCFSGRLKTHATRVSLTGGVAFHLADRVQAVVDVFYMPLPVKRGVNAPRQNDSLFNARAVMTYRAR